MITEEEYRKYNHEIEQYKADYYKQHKNADVYDFKTTDKWKNDLRIKALKADIYRFSNSANEAYYYLMNPDEAVRKNSNLEKLERIYEEKSEKLKDLKYVAKIFYAAPYIRRQFIDDDTTLKDIQKEIDKTERHLKHLEMKINTADADYKIEKIMEKYKYEYTYAIQRLSSCQKKLKEIEKN